ncbi:response regulator transcription factor [Marinobacteraceae bacterium S3BR75-40.1]
MPQTDNEANGSAIRVLIVEDKIALAENLFEFFDDERYALDFAADGLTALHLVSTNSYDVIVLDVMLPGLSGYELCDRIRRDLRCNTPIIFMTALDSLDDKEAGFSRGGDDYLVKPFELRELELRIKALHRRRTPNRQTLRAGSLQFDPGTLRVTLESGRVAELSGIPARLMEQLVRAYPNYLSRTDLNRAIWGVEDVDTHTLRTHIYALRKALQSALDQDLIKTVHGRGYRLLAPEEAAS